MESERRKHQRSYPREEILAILSPTPTLAKVKDMSQGGMRLEYISGPKAESNWSHVNLFLTKSKMYLSGLPLRLIYDRQTERESLPAQFLNRRECGLEFGKLSGLQAGQLQNILHGLLDGEARASLAV